MTDHNIHLHIHHHHQHILAMLTSKSELIIINERVRACQNIHKNIYGMQ